MRETCATLAVVLVAACASADAFIVGGRCLSTTRTPGFARSSYQVMDRGHVCASFPTMCSTSAPQMLPMSAQSLPKPQHRRWRRLAASLVGRVPSPPTVPLKLQELREAFVRRAMGTRKGAVARLVALRRAIILSGVGIMTAFVLMTASAGPAFAMHGETGARGARMWENWLGLPEHQITVRETILDMVNKDELDLRDYSIGSEQFSDRDLFGSKIKPSHEAKLALREHYNAYMRSKPRGLTGRVPGGESAAILIGVVGSLVTVVATIAHFIKVADVVEDELMGEKAVDVDATEIEEEDEDEDGLDLEDSNPEDGFTPPPSTAGDSPDDDDEGDDIGKDDVGKDKTDDLLDF